MHMPYGDPQFLFSEYAVIITFLLSAMLEAVRNAPEGFEDEDGFHVISSSRRLGTWW